MVFEGGKPVQHGQNHHAPGEPEVNNPRRVGLSAGIAKGCRNLEQAKNVNRLTVSRRNKIAANQDGKQQRIKGNMRGDCADAGKFAVSLCAAGGGEMCRQITRKTSPSISRTPMLLCNSGAW